MECHTQCYPTHSKSTSPTLFALLPPTFDSSSSQAHELVMSLKVVLEPFVRANLVNLANLTKLWYQTNSCKGQIIRTAPPLGSLRNDNGDGNNNSTKQ